VPARYLSTNPVKTVSPLRHGSYSIISKAERSIDEAIAGNPSVAKLRYRIQMAIRGKLPGGNPKRGPKRIVVAIRKISPRLQGYKKGDSSGIS
jgi:hypothetical protein